MTVIEWDQEAARRYEAGVSRGVFYPSPGPGIPWNGLISVNEGNDGGEVSTYFLEGSPFLETVSGKNYEAEVTAFSSPPGFSEYDGRRPYIQGLFLTGQPRKRFNFAYRTGTEDWYKIHLVYNVLAVATAYGHTSKGSSAVPSLFSWRLSATPSLVDGFKPSAHFILDSAKAPAPKLLALSNILYGTTLTDPRFPTPAELLTLFSGGG